MHFLNRSRLWLAAFGVNGITLARSLAARDDTTFDWFNLTASTNLTWTPCYGDFQCARLTVPLQYSDPTAGEAQVAIAMAPSSLPHDSPAYLGPLLFNPGGPGGSGVDSVVQNVALFRAVLGSQYDIIGFDPRGVGHTTPLIPIFKTPAEALEFFGPYPTNVNESISSFGRQTAQAAILGDLAVARAQKEAESVSTPAVATDMLNIVKAFGREQLAYYGISYGSILGATFAAMFPNNVGRIAIDGIINAHSYYQGTYFAKDSLLDTDAALTSVYEACVAAGPSLCPIFEKSADLVRARVNKLIENIHVAPVPIFDASESVGKVFAVVDYAIVVESLFDVLSNPYTGALQFAEAVVQLEQGNGTLMFQGSDAQGDIDPLATCDFDPSQPFSAQWLDIEVPISCGDSLVNTRLTLEGARAQYDGMLQLSEMFAPAWYPLIQGLCSGWTVQGKDRLNGSFETNTSFPLLIIANTFDPVTPLENARNMSVGFAGSVLLQQNSTGHTSQSGLSTCTAQALSAYFNNGTLPEPGTVCQLDSDTKIFGQSSDPASALDALDSVQTLARSSFAKRAFKLSRRMMGRSLL